MSNYQVDELEEEDYTRAVEYMCWLNKSAYEILKNYRVHTHTDVTDFGLLGHLSEMVVNASTVILSDWLNTLPRATEAAENFLFTARSQRNRNGYGENVAFETDDFTLEEVLFDPQTTGGFLISVDPIEGKSMLEAMHFSGIEAASIGGTIEKSDTKIYVRWLNETTDARILPVRDQLYLRKKPFKKKISRNSWFVQPVKSPQNLTKWRDNWALERSNLQFQKRLRSLFEENDRSRLHPMMEEDSGEYSVIISSDHMDIGDETLSKTLLEGFVYALTVQDVAPKYVVFYNTGISLPSLNDKIIGDLKTLRGKRHPSPFRGFCLGHYELKEKLKVGEIINMYRIT